MTEPTKVFWTWKLVVVATLGVVVTYLRWEYVWPTSLSWLLDQVFFTAFMLAALISGNIHAPNEFITGGILFLIYLGIAAGFQWFFRFARKQIQRSGAKGKVHKKGS